MGSLSSIGSDDSSSWETDDSDESSSSDESTSSDDDETTLQGEPESPDIMESDSEQRQALIEAAKRDAFLQFQSQRQGSSRSGLPQPENDTVDAVQRQAAPDPVTTPDQVSESEATSTLALNSEATTVQTDTAETAGQVVPATSQSSQRRNRWHHGMASPPPRYQKTARMALLSRDPLYFTKIAITDKDGNVLSENYRYPKGVHYTIRGRREVRFRKETDEDLDPEYFDHRIWERTGQIAGQTHKVQPRPASTPETVAGANSTVPGVDGNQNSLATAGVATSRYDLGSAPIPGPRAVANLNSTVPVVDSNQNSLFSEGVAPSGYNPGATPPPPKPPRRRLHSSP